MTLCAGCDRPAVSTSARSELTRKSTVDDLEMSLDYLKRLDEFDKQQAVLQATYHLNSWIQDHPASDSWQPDPLIRTLPRAIRDGLEIGQLDKPQFHVDDTEEILEAIWARELARWIRGRAVESPLAAGVDKQAASLAAAAGNQLRIAYRLFDWTVRNVQLEPLLDYPADPVAIGTEEAGRRRPPPPMRGLPGPGYQLEPWQVLLFGHGDALGRARVFIQLARQEGIPVVMLAFPGQTTPPRPRPWVTAALLDQRLYLFDTRLGLPIPGPGKSIATLDQVVADPALLSSLKVGEEFEYRVATKDLAAVQALIDASASALSRRMESLENNLSGDRRLRLTVDASQIGGELEKCEGISAVGLWAISHEAAWFKAAVEQALLNNKQFQAQYFLKFGVYQTETALAKARYTHFFGRFDSRGDDKGAKKLYLDSRVPDRRIDAIRSSPEVQQAFGMKQLADESDAAYRNRLAGTMVMVSQTKVHASYFLGLAHHDSGNPEAAIEWLRKRTLEAFPGGPWTDGAKYNLGRAYEALGRIEDAREQFLVGDSPQQHGNMLRARLLRQHRD